MAGQDSIGVGSCAGLMDGDLLRCVLLDELKENGCIKYDRVAEEEDRVRWKPSEETDALAVRARFLSVLMGLNDPKAVYDAGVLIDLYTIFCHGSIDVKPYNCLFLENQYNGKKFEIDHNVQAFVSLVFAYTFAYRFQWGGGREHDPMRILPQTIYIPEIPCAYERRADFFMEIGLRLMAAEDYRTAIALRTNDLGHGDNTDNLIAIAADYRYAALLFFTLRIYDKAMNMIDSAIFLSSGTLFDKSDDTDKETLLSLQLCQKGQIHLAMGNVDEGVRYLAEGLNHESKTEYFPKIEDFFISIYCRACYCKFTKEQPELASKYPLLNETKRGGEKARRR